MSFMFNPYPYEDFTAINRPRLSERTVRSVVSGGGEVCSFLSRHVAEQVEGGTGGRSVLCLDGFIGARFEGVAEIIRRNLGVQGIETELIRIDDCYKTSEELEAMLEPNLPADREKDPILLYGSIFHGSLEDYLDQGKVEALERRLKALAGSGAGEARGDAPGSGRGSGARTSTREMRPTSSFSSLISSWIRRTERRPRMAGSLTRIM